jgi:hypothetical protein
MSSQTTSDQKRFRDFIFDMIQAARNIFQNAHQLKRSSTTPTPYDESLSHLCGWGKGLTILFQIIIIDFDYSNEVIKKEARDMMLNKAKTNLTQAITATTRLSSSLPFSHLSLYTHFLSTERDFLTFFMSPYYVACVCALRGDVSECYDWIQLAKDRNQLPPKEEILRNSSFFQFQNVDPFKKFFSTSILSTITTTTTTTTSSTTISSASAPSPSSSPSTTTSLSTVSSTSSPTASPTQSISPTPEQHQTESSRDETIPIPIDLSISLPPPPQTPPCSHSLGTVFTIISIQKRKMFFEFISIDFFFSEYKILRTKNLNFILCVFV